MQIPRACGETVFSYVLTTIVVVFSILALFNLANGLSVIFSLLWLFVVALGVWNSSKDEGLRQFLIAWIGDLAGRKFVEITSSEVESSELRFGVQFLGKRFVQKCLKLGKVESVDWSPGQATGMAGRDMKDWHVCVWTDQDDPAKRSSWSRKPNQEPYVFGPSRAKEKTEILAREFIDFLQDRGVRLIPGKSENCYVREENDLPDAAGSDS
jgi:hypothetical protein